MSEDTATPQARASLIRLWLWAMQHDQVRQAGNAIRSLRGEGHGRITRLRWVPE